MLYLGFELPQFLCGGIGLTKGADGRKTRSAGGVSGLVSRRISTLNKTGAGNFPAIRKCVLTAPTLRKPRRGHVFLKLRQVQVFLVLFDGTCAGKLMPLGVVSFIPV